MVPNLVMFTIPECRQRDSMMDQINFPSHYKGSSDRLVFSFWSIRSPGTGNRFWGWGISRSLRRGRTGEELARPRTTLELYQESDPENGAEGCEKCPGDEIRWKGGIKIPLSSPIDRGDLFPFSFSVAKAAIDGEANVRPFLSYSRRESSL